MAQILSRDKIATIRAKYPAQQEQSASGQAEQKASTTKDDLYQRATKLGIEGRSTMDKETLKKAVEAAEKDQA